MIHSARIERTWNELMREVGFGDYCDSTASFYDITYFYTSDAPKECVEKGEELWRILTDWFGWHSPEGTKVTLTQQPPDAVTRRMELWEK